MGLYRTLLATLTCERCRESREFDLQFYWGDMSELPVHRVGEMCDSAEAFPRGHVFDSYSDYYCRQCVEGYPRAQGRAFFLALAELMEDNAISVARCGMRLSASQLRQEGRESPGPGIPNLSAWLSQRALDVRVAGEEMVTASTEHGLRVFRRFERMANSILQEDGWPHGTKVIRTDTKVVVTAEGRFTVVVENDYDHD